MKFSTNEQLANFLAYHAWRAVYAKKFAGLGVKFSPVDPLKKATVGKSDKWESTKVKFNIDGKMVEFGAIVPKKGVSASDAIIDLFNGKWEDLSVDCITAQVLINRRALLDVIGKEAYDKMFNDKPISGFRTEEGLLGYENVALKPVLGKDKKPVIGKDGKPVLITNHNAPVAIGSTGAFDNPGAVKDRNDPAEVAAAAWLYENVVYLGKNEKGEDYYFAHGIGIATKEEILEALKKEQKKPITPIFLPFEFDYSKLPPQDKK